MNTGLFSWGLVLLWAATTLTAPISDNPLESRKQKMRSRDEQWKFFRKFGYSGRKQDKNDESETEEEFRKSIRKVQKFAGLQATGEMDDATISLMATPRCGVSDENVTSTSRRKRYLLYGIKWPTKSLKYYIQNYTPDLPTGVTRNVIEKALNYWKSVSGLTFDEQSTSANINIAFASGNHGDRDPFDGVGGVLAHAFYPRVGDIHFDEAETWTDQQFAGTNLLQVATHEVGHALGLQHSQVRTAVMYPYYYSYIPNFALDKDDIQGIQALYGLPNQSLSTSSTIKSSTRSPSTSSSSTTTTIKTSSTTSKTTPITSTPRTIVTTNRRRRICWFFGWSWRC